MTPSRLLEKLTLDLPRRFRDRAAARGPLPAPTSPMDGGRGRFAAAAALPGEPWAGAMDVGNRVLAEVSAFRWPQCPESGAHLPEVHRAALEVDPGAWGAARRAHRHRWFSTLARTWAETGSVAHAVAATEALSEWLSWDRPEVGVPWLHASDAAVRLVNWALGAGWLGEELDADLWRRMAGSADAHARFLEANLSLGADREDHRLIAQAVGLVVAGLTWPQLDGARRWWSQGLTLLGHHLPRQLDAGGVPRDLSLSLLHRTLTLALVARATCRANSVAFPAAAEGALARGAWLLRVAAGDLGDVPSIGAEIEPPLEPWGAPAGLTPWNAISAALEGEHAAPGAAADRTAMMLAGGPLEDGDVLAIEREWVMFAFREGGFVSLHGEVKKQPSRILFNAGHGRGLASHQDLFQILWDIGDVPVLVDPGGEGPGPHALARAHSQLLYRGEGLPRPGRAVEVDLERARADGRDATIVASHDAFGPVHRRDVRVGGARIVVSDTLEGASGEVEIRWPVGPAWPIGSIEGEDFTVTAGELSLKIKLDPELTWTLEEGEVIRGSRREVGPVLVGRGRAEGTIRYRCSFEIR
jgi:hypothetical protein